MYVMCHLPFSPLPQVYTVLSAIGGRGEEEERRRRKRRRDDVVTIKQNSSTYW